MISERGGDALDGFEQVNANGMLMHAEFAGVEFGHDIVDVEDNLGAGQLRVPGGEHEEIGDVVDVEQVVRAAPMLAEQPEGGSHEKAHDGQEMRQAGFFGFAVAGLEPEQVNVAEGFLGSDLGGASKSQHIDVVTPLSESLSVARNAGIGKKVGMGDHADAAGFASRLEVVPCDESRQISGQRLPKGVFRSEEHTSELQS